MLYNKPPFLSYIDGEGEVRGSQASLLPATTHLTDNEGPALQNGVAATNMECAAAADLTKVAAGSSSVTMADDTPPRVMDLHAFGCRAVALKAPHKQNKTALEPRGEVGKFLGRVRHSPGTYAVLVNGKVVETSSVLVDEEHLARCVWIGRDRTPTRNWSDERDSVAVLRVYIMLYNKPPFLSYIDGEGEVRGSQASLLPAATDTRKRRKDKRRL